jgi:hypothetical protein
MLAPTKSDRDALESYIEKLGLKAVLESIGEVCSEKAEHIESAWQDRALAAVWTKEAVRLGSFTRGVKV